MPVVRITLRSTNSIVSAPPQPAAAPLPATYRRLTTTAGPPTPPTPRGAGEPPPARAHRSREHVCRLHRRTAEPPGLGPPLPHLNAHTALATCSTASPSARLASRLPPTRTQYTPSEYTFTHTHTRTHTHLFSASRGIRTRVLRRPVVPPGFVAG